VIGRAPCLLKTQMSYFTHNRQSKKHPFSALLLLTGHLTWKKTAAEMSHGLLFETLTDLQQM